MDNHKPSKQVASRRRCMICGREDGGLIAASALPHGVADVIAKLHPAEWAQRGVICRPDLHRLRIESAVRRLQEERGELSAVEREIAVKAGQHAAIASDAEEEFVRTATLGQRLADAVARIGGSWSFVLTFVALLLAWAAVNTFVLTADAFDPYPYILLNLVLSCIAALQAPVIMMSQIRAAARDRAQSDEDYRVNLKAEIEISTLHDKMDHLLHTQWEGLIEIQQLQLDMLTELIESSK